MKLWRCHLCDRGFVHGRFLATHLIVMHAERPVL